MRPTVKLWGICQIRTWKKDANYWTDDWQYAFFTCWKEILKAPDYSFDTEAILIAWNWDVWDCKYYKWKFEAYQRTYVLDAFDERLDIHYVFHLLSWKLKWHVLKQIKWSAIPYIKLWALQNFEIPLPPLETQKAIVAKLDQIFAELDQTKSEIQKNLDNTDELWKSALNQAFQGDWEMKKLGEVCDKITDWSHNPPKWIENSDYIMISSRNIDEWKIIFDDVRYLEKQDFDLEDKRTNVKEWDVLLSIVWTIWKVCVVKKEYWKFTMQRSVAVVKPLENKLYSYYLSYFLQAPLFQNVINENARWVAQKWIYLNSVKSLQIPVPPLSEQEKIVEHLDQVSKEVKALKSQYQSQLDNLEELKKSVLDKAFRWEMGE